MTKKRLKPHKRRSMARRLRGGKKPLAKTSAICEKGSVDRKAESKRA